jgi:hypothetical protein
VPASAPPSDSFVHQTVSKSGSGEAARTVARRQLGRVLALLAVLDVSVLVFVVGLALAWARFRFPVEYFLTFILVGVGGFLIARFAIGVRLKRRSGDL